MFKKFIILPFIFAFCLAFGQHKPVPEYLVKQPLPDSVRATPLLTLSDNPISLGEILDQYQGKKIMIDVWATYCKDCIVTIPAYNDLRKAKKKEDVVFLLLSVDRENAKWKAGISKFKLKGEHYFFTQGWKNPFSNYINLDWIPRYLVLDEAGNVIVPKSIHVDDQIISESLN